MKPLEVMQLAVSSHKYSIMCNGTRDQYSALAFWKEGIRLARGPFTLIGYSAQQDHCVREGYLLHSENCLKILEMYGV